MQLSVVKQSKFKNDSGLAILTDSKWKIGLHFNVHINERIIIARFKIETGYIYVISIYVSKKDHDKV